MFKLKLIFFKDCEKMNILRQNSYHFVRLLFAKQGISKFSWPPASEDILQLKNQIEPELKEALTKYTLF